MSKFAQAAQKAVSIVNGGCLCKHPTLGKDRKQRLQAYKEAVFPGCELAEGLSDWAWEAAERYVSACTLAFSPLAAVRTGVRGTALIGAAGDYTAGAAAFRGM